MSHALTTLSYVSGAPVGLVNQFHPTVSLHMDAILIQMSGEILPLCLKIVTIVAKSMNHKSEFEHLGKLDYPFKSN